MTFKDYVIRDLTIRFDNKYKFTGEVFGKGLGHEAYTKGLFTQRVFPEASASTISAYIQDVNDGAYSPKEKGDSLKTLLADLQHELEVKE